MLGDTMQTASAHARGRMRVNPCALTLMPSSNNKNTCAAPTSRRFDATRRRSANNTNPQHTDETHETKRTTRNGTTASCADPAGVEPRGD
jgi:hypothetical protein